MLEAEAMRDFWWHYDAMISMTDYDFDEGKDYGDGIKEKA